MAEAFVESMAGDGVEAAAACFEEGSIGRLPRQAMAEVGLVLGDRSPRSVFDRYGDGEPFDFVVTLCHRASTELCPIFVSNVDLLYGGKSKRRTWSIPSFRAFEGSEAERLDQIRIARDTIRNHVRDFLLEIGVTAAEVKRFLRRRVAELPDRRHRYARLWQRVIRVSGRRSALGAGTAQRRTAVEESVGDLVDRVEGAT